MKVALVNPGRGRRWTVSEPLNLGYIASYLKQNGMEVKIIDQLAGQDVNKEISAYVPDIVGITATTPLAPAAYNIADMCRKKGILTVIGGVHASVMPEEALTHADIVVVGEGETAMLDIIKTGLRSGIVSHPFVKNIDELPPPARHLMNQDFYLHILEELGEVMAFLHFFPPSTRVATLLTSRGCPFRCIFCHNSWRQAPVRFHSAERVLSEIAYLKEDYGVEAIFFMDDNLLANKPRLEQICTMMIKERLNIAWGCNASSHYINLATAQMIREAGCREVVFGWESGSQRILDVLEKRTTVERNREATKLCKQAGLIVTGTFMIGNPTETMEDIRATQQFIKELGDQIDMYGVCITTPYPGTKLWDWCNERGLIPRRFSWSDFNQGDLKIRACETLSARQLRRAYLETFGLRRVGFSRAWKRGLWHLKDSITWALGHPTVAARILLGKEID
jgi:radical SAM superfamily enzyme YgiQ (UPF0313 family)